MGRGSRSNFPGSMRARFIRGGVVAELFPLTAVTDPKFVLFNPYAYVHNLLTHIGASLDVIEDRTAVGSPTNADLLDNFVQCSGVQLYSVVQVCSVHANLKKSQTLLKFDYSLPIQDIRLQHDN